MVSVAPVAMNNNAVSFIKEVNPWLAKRPLKTNWRSANRRLTSLVKEATVMSAEVAFTARRLPI